MNCISLIDDEEKAICLGIIGGMVKYLSMLDDTKTLDKILFSYFSEKPVICMRSQIICWLRSSEMSVYIMTSSV